MKEVLDWTRLEVKRNSLGIVQETEIWPYYEMLCFILRIPDNISYE